MYIHISVYRYILQFHFLSFQQFLQQILYSTQQTVILFSILKKGMFIRKENRMKRGENVKGSFFLISEFTVGIGSKES